MAKLAPGTNILDECAAHVWEKVLDLSSEIRRFRSELDSCQSEVRRTLILHGDAAEQGARGRLRESGQTADPFPMYGGARA